MNDFDRYFIKNGFVKNITLSCSIYELYELIIKYKKYKKYHNIKIFFEKRLIATFSYNVLFKDDFSDIESFIDKKLRYIKLNNINNESKATDT